MFEFRYDTVRSLVGIKDQNEYADLGAIIKRDKSIGERFYGVNNQGKHLVLLSNPKFENGEINNGVFRRIVIPRKKVDGMSFFQGDYDVMFPDSVRGIPELKNFRFFDFMRSGSQSDTHSQVFHVDPFLAFLSINSREEYLVRVNEAKLGNRHSYTIDTSDDWND